ncbi:DNA-binding response regulator [Thalassotalea insulae]|uniref:DNA-binding response regulator n=1 Tax=Thalassotalea insulae TaxID=2056778 RepID=A0ABQ6GQM2_9GAMM|nr:response regulator [Thalassotalea insulae]GLX77484.1 DNA-binding response regulator [Thalassotalea insulae]
MTRITLVEDDVRLANLIKQFLQQHNFQVTVFNSGENAPELILASEPDIVILDIMLPKMDGFTICKTLRKSFDNPIIFLTAKDSDFDHVLGLEIGADDYIIKPVVPHVLLAHINVVLRRIKQHKRTEEQDIIIGELSIFRKSRQVIYQQQNVELTTHEFELLWLLAKNAGEPQSRDYIHKHIIGREYDGLDRSVDVRISRLRKKLKDDPDNPYKIITVWGKGYLFNTDAWHNESSSKESA